MVPKETYGCGQWVCRLPATQNARFVKIMPSIGQKEGQFFIVSHGLDLLVMLKNSGSGDFRQTDRQIADGHTPCTYTRGNDPKCTLNTYKFTNNNMHSSINYIAHTLPYTVSTDRIPKQRLAKPTYIYFPNPNQQLNPLNAHPETTRKSLNAEGVGVASRSNEPRGN